MSNITPDLKSVFSLPSNSFYGPTIINKSFVLPSLLPITPPLNMKNTTRTVFTQSTSRTTIVEQTIRKRRFSTNSSRRSSLLSFPVPVQKKTMEGAEKRSRSNRSVSPDWLTCRFSLPPVVIKKEENKKRRRREDESKKENLNRRSVSPDWNTSRFSLPPPPPPPKKLGNANSGNLKLGNPTKSGNPTTTKSGNPIKQGNPKTTSNTRLPKKPPRRSRSASPDWATCRFSLPITTKTPQPSKPKTINKKSPRITAPLVAKSPKTKTNIMYKISQKTLDSMLPKPEIHLFDVVKYGPRPQHKDDFLFGLNLMRSEVLNKIDLLHYKKKLRNTGMDFIRTFQETKSSRSARRRKSNNEKVEEVEVASIEIPDDPSPLPDEIIIEDDTFEAPLEEKEEVILIEDEGSEKSEKREKLLEEAIQDFAEKFGGEVIVEEITENTIPITINLTDNNGDKDKEIGVVKISETNTFTKKRNSLDSSKPRTKLTNVKRNSLPNLKNLKNLKDINGNGVPKKKVSQNKNKKKNIIKVKWPIARKSLLDLRNTN